MSAATVPITAIPETTRRRSVVAEKKKSTVIELVSAEPQSKNVEETPQTSNTQDVINRSIRGESGSDRSDLPKRTVPNFTTLPPSNRRSRKTLAADSRPRWVSILSIFTKNFILLLLIVGLFQIVRWLYLGSSDGVPMAYSHMERRITEVEAFMKTTTKMVQVQVEVMDRKIESEVGGFRREVEKIEDKRGSLESELKKLETKTDGLEKSIGELRGVEWLSKQEFEKVYEELKKAKNGENGGDVSLDDIRAYARNVVEKEIEKHSADGLGMVDYALAVGGAYVVKHSEPYLSSKGNSWFAKFRKTRVHPDADKMLSPSFGEPAQCFALQGGSGFVQIKLRVPIIPEAITLEHVAKSVAYDRSSAPKDCRVSGWLGTGDDQEVNTGKMFYLAEFTYDLERSNAQTFNVLDLALPGLVDTVSFDFKSNHGSPFTCIYRLRVHGHEPEAVSMIAM